MPDESRFPIPKLFSSVLGLISSFRRATLFHIEVYCSHSELCSSR